MIRECQVFPINLPAQIEEQRNASFVQSINPFFKAQRVQVNAEQMKARSELLFPPAIQYNPRGEIVEPDQRGGGLQFQLYFKPYLALDWKMVGRDVNPNRQYIQPAEWPKRWAIIIVQNAIPPNVCQYVLFFKMP